MIAKKISSKILKIVTVSAFMSVDIACMPDQGAGLAPLMADVAPVAQFAKPEAKDLQELLRIINIVNKPSKSFSERYGFVDRLFHLPFYLAQNSIYGIGLFLRFAILPPGNSDENKNACTWKNPDYVRFAINKNPQYVKGFNILIWALILGLLSGLVYNIVSNCGLSLAQAVVYAKRSWIFVSMFGLLILIAVYTLISLIIEQIDGRLLRALNPYHDEYNIDIAKANIAKYNNNHISDALKDPIQTYLVDGNKNLLLCNIAVIINEIITKNSDSSLIKDIDTIITTNNNFGLNLIEKKKQITINFVILVLCSVLAIKEKDRAKEYNNLDDVNNIKDLYPKNIASEQLPNELKWFYDNLKLKHYMTETTNLDSADTTVKEIIKSLDDIRLHQETNSLAKIKNMNILISLSRFLPVIAIKLIGWAQQRFYGQKENFGFKQQQNQLKEYSIWVAIGITAFMFIIFMTTPQFIAFREYMEGLCSLKVLIACCKSYWGLSLIFGLLGIGLIAFLVVFIIYALDMQYRNKSVRALQRINKDSDPQAIIKQYAQAKIYAQNNEDQINTLNEEFYYDMAAYFYQNQSLDKNKIAKIIEQVNDVLGQQDHDALKTIRDSDNNIDDLLVSSMSDDVQLIYHSLVGCEQTIIPLRNGHVRSDNPGPAQ